MGFWMRMLVISIPVCICTNTLRAKIDVKKNKVPKRVDSYGIILAGGIVHDFNKRFTAIQGWTILLSAGIDEKSPAFQDVKAIR